jgi:hypothetical protein
MPNIENMTLAQNMFRSEYAGGVFSDCGNRRFSSI